MSRNSNAKPPQILYIGREDPTNEKVWQGLVQEGIGMTSARTQSLGLQLARSLQPNIVVINPTNSHFSGERLSRSLKRTLPRVRRVLLIDRGQGQQIECEERLVRPFTPKKLRETLGKLLSTLDPHLLRIGEIELDLQARTLLTPHGMAHLTPKQTQLLAVFMQRPNQVISREELMREIWDTRYLGDTRTLDVHIRWLREKVEANPTRPVVVVTVRKVGYRMVAPKHGASPDEDDPVE